MKWSGDNASGRAGSFAMFYDSPPITAKRVAQINDQHGDHESVCLAGYGQSDESGRAEGDYVIISTTVVTHSTVLVQRPNRLALIFSNSHTLIQLTVTQEIESFRLTPNHARLQVIPTTRVG